MLRRWLLLLTLAVTTAWAQQPTATNQSGSAPAPAQQAFNLKLFNGPSPQFARSQAFRFLPPSPLAQDHSYWYWEVDDTRRVPFPAYNYIPGQMAISDDISPVSLHWTLSGRRPLVPAFEIAGYQVKPGEGVSIYQKNDGRFNLDPSASSNLWLKTKHMIKESLKY
ncbi:MAG TPA: hypothetical protein VEG30_00815 [Terriglobales bacterium]|nr:hypothetical protein [Terriglobales bacterium]